MCDSTLLQRDFTLISTVHSEATKQVSVLLSYARHMLVILRHSVRDVGLWHHVNGK